MESINKIVNNWVKEYIISMNLCPYAFQAMKDDLVVIKTTKTEEFHIALHETKILFLEKNKLSTILLAFEDNISFEQLLKLYEFTLEEIEDWVDEFQVVLFHEDYLHKNHDLKDIANYTNRSPVPMIQLISFRDIKKYHNPTDTKKILANNQITLESIGLENLQKKLNECRSEN